MLKKLPQKVGYFNLSFREAPPFSFTLLNYNIIYLLNFINESYINFLLSARRDLSLLNIVLMFER